MYIAEAARSRAHLLLIEDDPMLAQLLQRGLSPHGFAVEVAPEGEEGLTQLLTGDHDICILDVMLPSLDGFTLLKRARQEGVTTPVLILSACNSIADRVNGLQLGADDYLTKPFAFDELTARLRALLRRGTRLSSKLCAGDLELDTRARRLWRGGQEIALPNKEFALLELLLHHRGQVLTRQVLLRWVWGRPLPTGSNLVDVRVTRLRQKIDRPGEPSLIQTVRGVGYLLRDGER